MSSKYALRITKFNGKVITQYSPVFKDRVISSANDIERLGLLKNRMLEKIHFELAVRT